MLINLSENIDYYLCSFLQFLLPFCLDNKTNPEEILCSVISRYSEGYLHVLVKLFVKLIKSNGD